METISAILNGFHVALAPLNIFYAFIGAFMGTLIGVLPGIGPAAGISLLIPLTFGMEPTSALIMMAGIYYGAQYGGSTTSILINTPGENSSVMTCLDGYAMAKNGRAGAALAISAIGSFLAGTIGILLLSFSAVALSKFALRFGPPEYFTLMLFAMTAVGSLTGKSLARGMIATILGLICSTVGIDLQSGLARYSFGIPELQDGISFLIVAVGLFAVGEVFKNIEDFFKAGANKLIPLTGRIWLTKEEWRRSIKPIVRGGLVGYVVGVLPGAGGTLATILSYALEKKVSRHPEEFGKGAIEGVAGPESANNSSCNGALVPLLTLGVPGSGTTAVMLGVFIMYGIQPGPSLFQDHPLLVWGLIDSMYIGNLMLLVLNLPLLGLFVRLLYIPIGILMPLIITISMTGIYSINTNVFDLYMVLLFGVLGWAFRKMEIPLAPFVLALVLGSLLEQSFRQAMTLSDGNLLIFVRSSISTVLLVIASLSIVLPYLIPKIQRWKHTVESDSTC